GVLGAVGLEIGGDVGRAVFPRQSLAADHGLLQAAVEMLGAAEDFAETRRAAEAVPGAQRARAHKARRPCQKPAAGEELIAHRLSPPGPRFRCARAASR